ncbi:hypothetical protein Tco_1011313, partial [Tanacetum coccineum]
GNKLQNITLWGAYADQLDVYLGDRSCLKTLELKRQIIRLASWPNTIDMMSIKLQKVKLSDIRDIAEIKSVVVVATIK